MKDFQTTEKPNVNTGSAFKQPLQETFFRPQPLNGRAPIVTLVGPTNTGFATPLGPN
jgi:hypothetical protein